MIYIKSEFDISNIRKVCDIWKYTKNELIKYVKEGISLNQIDKFAKQIIESKGAICTFKDYHGFKGNICLSVNDVIIHGVPSEYILKKSDMLSLDIGITYNNYICDSAFTLIIGENAEAEKISKVCYQALLEGINQIKPGNKVGDISNAIQTYVENKGYYILQDFGGHGCGIKLHEDPIILNYGSINSGPTLREGMIICLEPMIMSGSNEYYIDENDKWSVKSKNKELTCHWEHMILVTKNGYEILTKDEEKE